MRIYCPICYVIICGNSIIIISGNSGKNNFTMSGQEGRNDVTICRSDTMLHTVRVLCSGEMSQEERKSTALEEADDCFMARRRHLLSTSEPRAEILMIGESTADQLRGGSEEEGAVSRESRTVTSSEVTGAELPVFLAVSTRS